MVGRLSMECQDEIVDKGDGAKGADVMRSQ